MESVGLDPYVGFLHTDRPGRMSLALDLMVELRPALADRFVLTLINRRIVVKKDFIIKEIEMMNASIALKRSSSLPVRECGLKLRY